MKNFRFILLIAFIGVISLQSCKKDTPTVGKTDIVDATSYTDWVYYSLSLGDTVSISNPTEDNSWDIAFIRNHVKTNSGTSGSGKSGAYDAGNSDLAATIEANESGYTVDNDTITHYVMNFVAYPPTIDTIQISANPILETWGQFNDQFQFELNNKTFVIKTADEKFAKIALLNYYNTEQKGGYITFEYKYQEDGTTNIE